MLHPYIDDCQYVEVVKIVGSIPTDSVQGDGVGDPRHASDQRGGVGWVGEGAGFDLEPQLDAWMDVLAQHDAGGDVEADELHDLGAGDIEDSGHEGGFYSLLPLGCNPFQQDSQSGIGTHTWARAIREGAGRGRGLGPTLQEPSLRHSVVCLDPVKLSQ